MLSSIAYVYTSKYKHVNVTDCRVQILDAQEEDIEYHLSVPVEGALERNLTESNPLYFKNLLQMTLHSPVVK